MSRLGRQPRRLAPSAGVMPLLTSLVLLASIVGLVVRSLKTILWPLYLRRAAVSGVSDFCSCVLRLDAAAPPPPYRLFFETTCFPHVTDAVLKRNIRLLAVRFGCGSCVVPWMVPLVASPNFSSSDSRGCCRQGSCAALTPQPFAVFKPAHTLWCPSGTPCGATTRTCQCMKPTPPR